MPREALPEGCRRIRANVPGIPIGVSDAGFFKDERIVVRSLSPSRPDEKYELVAGGDPLTYALPCQCEHFSRTARLYAVGDLCCYDKGAGSTVGHWWPRGFDGRRA